MYEGHSVGVVVPAYNEAATVGTVLAHVPAFVDRIFVVDDCSTDGTWEVIRSFAEGGDGTGGDATADEDAPSNGDEPTNDDGADDGGDRVLADGGCVGVEQRTVGDSASDGRLVPIRHEENRGAGGALKTGYRHAREAGLDLVVTLDADGQMDPAIMDRFLEPLVGRERAFAKGDRLAAGHRDAMPRLRVVGNVALTHLTRVASGYWRLSDPQNGYTAITGAALAAVDLDALPDHHDYCNALLARLQVADVEVIDVPMRAVYGDEESTIDLRRFAVRTSWTLARSWGWRLRRQYLTTTGGPLGRVRSAVGAAGRVTGSAAKAGGDATARGDSGPRADAGGSREGEGE